MPHTKATPTNQRPTIEEMKFHEAAHLQEPHFVIYKITGKWSLNLESNFDIIVKGDIADVQEVYEMLRENGNLVDLKTECIND